MSEPYSPLRYPGGKTKIAPFLIEILKANELSEPHYIEPYAGGAGAALTLLYEEYASYITINDADPRIYCFWKSVLRKNDDFLDKLDNISISVQEWLKQKSIYERCDQKNYFELGFATFFLNRTTRSGIIHNGGPIGGYDQTGNYKIDVRFGKPRLIKNIQRINAYAERINISKLDGRKVIQVLNSSRARNVFVYLDPPYYEKGADLYMNNLKTEEHAALASFLRSGTNFPWVMTYDNVDAIQSLYFDLRHFGFDLSYSAYERRLGKELLIFPKHVRVTDESLILLPRAT